MGTFFPDPVFLELTLSEAIHNKPSISIVIASATGGDFLFHCLNSLVDQYENNGAEIIVVDRRGEEMVEKIEKDFPNIKLVATSPEDRLSVPELRCLGVQQARAEIVAVIEEHCIAAPDWIQSILTEIQPGDAAVGGPVVDSKYQRIQDWVVYFSEYHNYLPPWQAGPCNLLNGVNIAYNTRIVGETSGFAFPGILGSGFAPCLVRRWRFPGNSRDEGVPPWAI